MTFPTPPEPQTPVIITAQMLRQVDVCVRRVWLDAHGEADQRANPTPGVARLYAFGHQHEQRVHTATTAQISPVEVASWEDAVAATRDLMAQGVLGIIGACLELTVPLDMSDTLYTLRGQVDQLLRVQQHGETLYAPIEIKQRTRPDTADWLQLDFYVWLLSQMQGTSPLGELWLGADAAGRPRRRVAHDYDEERLLNAVLRVARLREVSPEPPVSLASHCKSCPWIAQCQDVAQREKRLDLLYGVSRTTRRNMEAAGIMILAHVVALTAEELQQIKGIGPKTAPRILANAQAWLDNAPVWLNALPEVCCQSGWMFDLETHEVRGKTVPWCMGWCDEHDVTHIALVAPVQLPEPLTLPDGQQLTLVPDSDSAWEVFADAIRDSSGPIYHWTGYDAAIMRDSAPAHVTAELAPRLHDLNSTLKRVVSLPLKSTSIKPVSLHLGFAWPGYNDWFAAYVDYQHWLERDEVAALERACMYQRADVQSMAFVWRWLMTHAPTAKH
ncbi:MAG: TM0106 family RecB-like putative nuclease [Anaerolineae bacterium]|nr:TM0106 family RecB-like putative nuclease [Anaerolineae bacterium]